MSRKTGRDASAWRGSGSRAAPGEGLRGLGLIILIALIGWLSLSLMPTQEADAYALPVVINRVMTSNPSACYSVGGKYYDWLELLNAGDEAVNLRGWKLTDRGDIRDGFTFGDVMLNPGQALLVYCDDAPENFSGPEIFTGFKLSANGETLLLVDPAQRVQSLEVPAMGKRDVFQRNPETGRYSALSFYQSLGLDQNYTSTLTPPYNPRGVSITEIMAVNRSTLMDEDGDFSDWIEIHNPTDQSVRLRGCTLSDDDAMRLKWKLPDVTLKPGEYRIIFASGKDRTDPSGELHTNFKLSKSGEAVRLYNPRADCISYVRYEHASPDVAFSRMTDGGMTAHLDPSPGQPNTALGARAATAAMLSNSAGLYINEVYVSGEGADWMEIHNAGDGAADLSGIGVSDNPGKPRKWQFPSGTTLPADGYLLLRLAGGNKKGEEPAGEPARIKIPAPEGSESRYAPVEADYTLPLSLSEGETLCLNTPEGRPLDRVKLYDQTAGVSFGRAEGYDSFRYFTELTPGKPNPAQSYGKVALPISFSTPPGIVRDQAIQLRMSTTPGVEIYYTTDGSVPTMKSRRYDGAVNLSANTCIRAVAMGDDVAPSQPVTASFIFGPHALRLVSITGDEGRLIGSKGTLRTGKKGAGVDVHVEMYEPNGVNLINQDCHLTVVGHHSRIHYDQKSIKLSARRNTGDTRFRAKLFSNRDYDEVKSVVLRASGQDVNQTHMRDSILTSLAAGTSVFYQETELCVVYVNGRYWGEYNMREHVDAHSIAQFEGWNDPDGVIISEGTPGGDSFKKLLSWVDNHDMSSNSSIETLRTMMDIENYLDYVIFEMYTCNQDLNNVARYYSREEDRRWKWVLFDLDLSYQIDRNNVKDWFSTSVGSITAQNTTPFRQLMRNSGIRDYFLTRFGELLATSLSSENVVGKITARQAALAPEMELNCKRWKWSIKTWEKWVNRTINYANARPAKLIKYIADAFHLSDADKERYFGEAMEKAAAQTAAQAQT